MYATAGFLLKLMSEPLLPLLSLLFLLLEVVACFVNSVRAGKFPLHSELSTRVPARIKDEKLGTSWMLSKVQSLVVLT